MSGDTGQYNQDTGLASPESEASSRTTSRRPTQSGSNLTSDKPRPPWKNTTPTPKLLEATRKVLKASKKGKTNSLSTQTEPEPCTRVKDVCVQTYGISPIVRKLIQPKYYRKQIYPVYYDVNYEFDTTRTQNIICDLLKEVTDLLKSFDKVATMFYHSSKDDCITETNCNISTPKNLEEKLMESCRQLSECIKRSETASEI